MFLSDVDIRAALTEQRVGISPFTDNSVSGCTVDLTLHSQFRVFENSMQTHIDVKEPFEVTQPVSATKEGFFIIHPGEFVLGSTAEQVTLPTDLCGVLEGRSSLGRIGLIVHATASLVKPGFSGYLTLEMANMSKLPIKLYAGMRIAQLAFMKLSSPAQLAYGKGKQKYQNQSVPMSSRIWEDFT